MISRTPNNKQYEVNIVGSSTFGRYPKISNERTVNMFISDNWLVPYAGYQRAIPNSYGTEGRGIYASSKLQKMIMVISSTVYLVDIFFDQNTERTLDFTVTPLGTLLSTTGPVYIAENNKPQIAISDGKAIYIYDPSPPVTIPPTPVFSQAPGLNFIPGYITFHDTYFIVAATQDQTYSPAASNTWRLSGQNNGYSWPSTASNVGLIQTKPDVTQAVVRFPSKGSMIIVMGKTVTEFWFDTVAQLFPYQRNNQGTIDYGCLSPATIASTDEMVVWLAANEKSGPIIMFTTGGMPERITTDGIDYLFSQLSAPEDSSAFIYRQDGHVIYHINFYTDNLSLFYDFNTKRFFHACDEKQNYFIAESVAYFNNQYYFITKNNGFLYAFDTIYTTYDGAMIPRFRICKSIRDVDQQYRVATDISFTIESGETDYYHQTLQFGDFVNDPPRVDLSISTDGGSSFGSDYAYVLPSIGQRKNKLIWWQLGLYNDIVPQFKFWGFGRFVATDGVLNSRT
jgi:hypothetical protein